MFRILGALVFLVGIQACGGGASPSPFGGDGRRGVVEVRVDNISFNDATVFLVTPRRRQRLGVVQGKSNGRFTLEWEGLQPVQIAVDLLAAQGFVGPSMTIAPGEIIDVQIREPVSNSVVSRRERR